MQEGTTRDQFKIIVAALKSNYRTFGIENKAQFDFWYEMLKDLDYQLLQTAVKKLVSESSYPPTIADIRKAASNVEAPEVMDAATAWGEVMNAIRNYGVYRPEEAVESMAPLTRKVVQAMNYQEICMSKKLGVDRGQFIRLYNQICERERTDRVLSLELKNNIKQLQAQNEDLRLLLEPSKPRKQVIDLKKYEKKVESMDDMSVGSVIEEMKNKLLG